MGKNQVKILHFVNWTNFDPIVKKLHNQTNVTNLYIGNRYIKYLLQRRLILETLAIPGTVAKKVDPTADLYYSSIVQSVIEKEVIQW